ncbi:hypothetical protein AMJ49_03830 [Parcubacteria bacterium DG_74_2]|nr:MAG: hypothetical protein AMJ49_03830 [Parcubacteria bacterium DG_74_2]
MDTLIELGALITVISILAFFFGIFCFRVFYKKIKNNKLSALILIIGPEISLTGLWGLVIGVIILFLGIIL